MVNRSLPSPSIAFDVTPLQNTHRFRGIGTYVRGLAERLRDQKDLPIEFWGWQGDEPFAVDAPHTTLWLPRMRMPEYRGAWIFAPLAMRRRAAQSRVRAVHVTDPEALVNLGRHTVLTTVYDLIPLREGVSPRRVFAWLGYRRYLRALRRVPKMFAISEETARDLERLMGIGPPRVVVARPGVAMPGEEDALRRRERPYFLFIGGPNPNKNLSVLIDAMALCTDVAEELVVTGQWLPGQLASLQARLAAMGLEGRVHHLGYVPAADLPGLMRHATAMVIPSLHEGFGLPVAEGLAAGAVVVHSDIPVMEEISAGAALMFDPRSPEALAARLREVSRDQQLRHRLRGAGRSRAVQLTWDAAVEVTLATYEAELRR